MWRGRERAHGGDTGRAQRDSSGRKDGYTPHPGLRARVRRVRAYVLRDGSPPVETWPRCPVCRTRRTRCPPVPQPGTVTLN
ncbi:hypothetical protein GBW32_24935 [Streptomyces tsukubensis]|nr:hypothetical protein GBW32_24935 [Streptomyces tsukubensis]